SPKPTNRSSIAVHSIALSSIFSAGISSKKKSSARRSEPEEFQLLSQPLEVSNQGVARSVTPVVKILAVG
ncbi:hypothetical protein, partial [uncultured Meiothermus sp.]|uniref:hypothetical protein n=1 Tax=uncultured Meiothermus sp. TaxID=157471 RepID=UPI00261BE0B6